MAERDQIIAISNAAADAAGIPRLLLLACGIAEGDLNPSARRPANAADDVRYWPDVSFGAWQQTIRWTDAYIKAVSKSGGDPAVFPGAGTIASIGADFYDPEYAAEVAAANLEGKYFPDEPDAVFHALCRYNFPGGHGRPASAGVAANYRNGIAQAGLLLGGSPMPSQAPVYNPDTPLILQNDDWSCWDTSARMALEAWGRHPTESWIEHQSQADDIDTTAVGLKDASGAAGAAWLTKQYSNPAEGTPTITAHNAASVSFDDVKSVAGSTAVMLGGRGWGAEGHWCFVRRYNPTNDSLELGNPAGTYAGIGQTMTRQQFSQVAPCSMIVVTADGAAPVPAPTPPASDPRDARIAQLQADLDDARSKLGVCTSNYADDLENVVKALRALKPA